MKRSITVEVEMTSNASEASLSQHFDSFMDEMKTHAKAMRFRSWFESINTSYDETEIVEIDVTITDNKM